MTNKTAILALIVALAALAVVVLRPAGNGVAPEKKETAFERVMRTNTLRCGYGIWAPGFMKDPNSGAFSGIFYDYLNALGKHTGLKIEWTAEIGWGDFPTALNDGRIDAFCIGLWPKAMVAREIMFTKPIYYLPINAYARADDNRFDFAPEKINSPDITISAMDSEMSSQLAAADFPQARVFSISQINPASDLLLNVASDKADITFTDAWNGASYMKNNPGKVKIVPFKNPLRLYGNTIAIPQGEHDLETFLNTATEELLNTGELDAIIKKYEGDMPGVLLHLPRPYETPQTP